MEFAYGVAGFVVGAAAMAGFFLWKNKALAAGAAPVATPAAPPPPAKPNGAPVRFLALLQSEARFFDFLMEDIAGFPDARIGQAVRDIHKNAQAAIKQHLVMEQVMPQQEGSAVTVPAGFDPSAIRVLGNVTGTPPFTGTLQHPGWRVREIKLAPPPAGADEFVIQPAEVQLS